MTKFHLLFLLFQTFIGFSQIETNIKGKLVSDDFSVSNAEIINFRTKKLLVSDQFGEFMMDVKINDLLVIIAKGCFEKKVYISSNLISQQIISIDIIKKANELKEVVVTKEKLVKPIEIAESNKINSYNTTMRANQSGVYTGETINGMDLVAIGKMIGKLFKRKSKKTYTSINFKEYIANNVNESFLYETLHLKKEDYYRFLEFCEADSNAIKLTEENNEFKILNFLFEKKDAFDKL